MEAVRCSCLNWSSHLCIPLWKISCLEYLIGKKSVGKKWRIFALVTNIFYRRKFLPTNFFTNGFFTDKVYTRNGRLFHTWEEKNWVIILKNLSHKWQILSSYRIIEGFKLSMNRKGCIIIIRLELFWHFDFTSQ